MGRGGAGEDTPTYVEMRPTPGAQGSEKHFSPLQSDIDSCASSIHELWRAPRLLADGSFDPRIKTTVDKDWIAEHGTDQIDIANTAYADQPKDWQKENRLASEGALLAVGSKGDALSLSDLEEASDEIHKQWLERNGEWAEEHQKLPYSELSEEEKEKDRVLARTACGVLGKTCPGGQAEAESLRNEIARSKLEAIRKAALEQAQSRKNNPNKRSSDWWEEEFYEQQRNPATRA